ncbi:cysteine desulfurase family protein [Microlunatus panaciterrae]|uniref:cysteine desulfurase n=1 Tax=Microlunatus panaciterrae TaxID=400768 RepID=A0ABS2RGM4_9ACTN|nr:cysteine desulfurase [Microlunatus panaciterrae]
MTRTYLDHAATTPMVPAAVEAMTAQLGQAGNASSLHGSGRAARRVVEESREEIAALVGARPTEVIFTSGGTESDNLAVKGAFWAGRERGRSRLIASAVEHHAVLDPLDWLERTQQATVDLVGVDGDGRVDLAALTQSLAAADDAALVSVMWANNEVGVVQPVVEIAERARERGVVSHSDAVQAVGQLEVDFADSGLDLLTLTAHKLGGPYGIGALLARRELTLTPVLHGGGQERELRSGTLDVPAVAAFAAAIRTAVGDRPAARTRLRGLRDRLVEGILATVPGAIENGPAAVDQRLPGIANLCFDGCEADSLLLLLDAAGIDCSAGSACSAGVSQPSHVLLAMGRTGREARSALRFSLGHSSTAADVQAVLAVLPEVVQRARRAGSMTG